MGTTTLPQGQATYVAPKPDGAWLLNEQRKLYRRSWEKPEYVFEKLWGLVTDPRNLRTAVARVARNRGKRTGGVDRVTVRMVVRDGVDTFVETVRAELRSGSYRPAPVRRVLIPKPGQLGKFRPLGRHSQGQSCVGLHQDTRRPADRPEGRDWSDHGGNHPSRGRPRSSTRTAKEANLEPVHQDALGFLARV